MLFLRETPMMSSFCLYGFMELKRLKIIPGPIVYYHENNKFTFLFYCYLQRDGPNLNQTKKNAFMFEPTVGL